MTYADLRLGPADVLEAAARIAGHVRRTPVQVLTPGLLLKCENLQRSGSFKIRGAAGAIIGSGARKIVTGSSGNHGLAVATLGRALGVGVVVVMAAGSSHAKATALRRLGAQVVHVEGGVVERDRHAQEYAALTGAVFVPSSDDARVVAGQGTVAVEVFEQVPHVDTIVVPTGGGGLLAGVCLAAMDRPVRIVGVEPETARRYALSMAADHPVEVSPSATIADGLRGQRPGEVPYPIIRGRVDDLVAVSDDAIRHAIDVLARAGVPAEASGAVALAAALDHGFAGTTVAVVSGGNTAAALATLTTATKGFS